MRLMRCSLPAYFFMNPRLSLGRINVSLRAYLLFLVLLIFPAVAAVKTVSLPPATSDHGCYTNNRAPLRPNPLLKLPIGAITPKGWLGHQLELEAQGLTGHLQEISKWCKFDGNAWADASALVRSDYGPIC